MSRESTEQLGLSAVYFYCASKGGNPDQEGGQSQSLRGLARFDLNSCLRAYDGGKQASRPSLHALGRFDDQPPPTLITRGTADKTVPTDASGRASAKAVEGSMLIEYEGAPHGLLATDK